jgi:hypothetical protein
MGDAHSMSCPDLIRASIYLEKNLAKGMDCRVEPGNDGLGVSTAQTSEKSPHFLVISPLWG